MGKQNGDETPHFEELSVARVAASIRTKCIPPGRSCLRTVQTIGYLRGDPMRRGYRCALFLALLCACFQTIGCGGSGTIPLSVATTSLPNGTVASVYTATLTASGGSSP